MNECLGLYNKPKVEVHPGHKEEEEEDLKRYNSKLQLLTSTTHIAVITTPYSNRPVLLYLTACLYFLGCFYEHL